MSTEPLVSAEELLAAGRVLGQSENGDEHHCISSAAALRNWYMHVSTGLTRMRPGIEELM